jgi:hypothetical protein
MNTPVAPPVQELLRQAGRTQNCNTLPGCVFKLLEALVAQQRHEQGQIQELNNRIDGLAFAGQSATERRLALLRACLKFITATTPTEKMPTELIKAVEQELGVGQ